ncbi:MAG: amidase family protein [Gammaproteobacteria bacterium]
MVSFFTMREMYKTISEIEQAFSKNETSAASMVQHLVNYIESENPKYRAVRELNPDAVEIARSLDAERKTGLVRSPLHGVPILIKDAFLTNDAMRTTYGVLALANLSSQFDSQIVASLRDAGAIILGKCSCTDFGDYMSSTMPAEHSTTGGTVINPRGIRYGRGGGSSTGSAAAVAAGFAPVSIGSEAQNSIQGPAANSGLFGFKPTVGLLPASHEPPLVASQTTAGVLANSIEDLVLVMQAIAPNENLIAGRERNERFRIGIPRQRIFGRPGMETYDSAFEHLLANLDSKVFQVIDNADLASVDDLFDLPSSVFKTEFRNGIEKLLATPDLHCEFRHLSEIIDYNEAHKAVAIPFGQDLLLAAEAAADADPQIYRNDRQRDINLSRARGIDQALGEQNLDALVAPMDLAAKVTGKAGYPVLTIPAGQTQDGKPFGLSLIGRAKSEQILIDIGFKISNTLRPNQ